MMHPFAVRSSVLWLAIACTVAFLVASGSAQQAPPAGAAAAQQPVPALPPRVAPPRVPDGPIVLDTGEQRVRVVVVTRGLSHPWGLAFLPDGNMLVSERPGRLRIIRGGALDPQPISGVPEVYLGANLAGLMDVAIHPRFAENKWVYLTYSKPQPGPKGEKGSTITLLRGKLEGNALTEVRDIFVADAWGNGTAASRIIFGSDGLLYMSVGGAINSETTGKFAQDPGSHIGKVVRLRDDGTAPKNNPFVGQAGYKPEIYSMGHRNQLGLAWHPETGALWASENAPQGGDEVNAVTAGRNYGWPLVSYGREYGGRRVSERPWREEFEQPMVVWLPSIAPSGLVFYTGSRYPSWKNNLFSGSMRLGRMWNTGHLERVVFNRAWEEIRRESLLHELKQRIRDVRQGPDGFLYLLTEEDEAVLLRLEPAE